MIKRIIKLVLIIILTFVVFVNIPIIQVQHNASSNDYSSWMNDTIDLNHRIVDMKMLGAHDAFSKDISIFSKVDPYADDIMQGYVGKILKGYLVKQSVTQTADTDLLLKSGVRYFDIRLTYREGEWTTKHNFTSSGFDDIAKSLSDYLDSHNGEFLVLDFQHINGLEYDSDEDYEIFLELLTETGLINYNYTDETKVLDNITYNDITTNKTTSRIIIIDKFTKIDKETYYYNTSIRSNWSDSDDFDETIEFLEVEANFLDDNLDYVNSFKVMQAVTTMQMTPDGILNSIKNWSLIERAADFNNYLLNDVSFETLSDVLPIIMVDYSNTNDSNFLDDVMEYIISENMS